MRNMSTWEHSMNASSLLPLLFFALLIALETSKQFQLMKIQYKSTKFKFNVVRSVPLTSAGNN